MLADKPVEAIAGVLAPVVDHVFAVGLPGPRGLTAEALQLRLRDGGLVTPTCDNMGSALLRARSRAGAHGSVAASGGASGMERGWKCVEVTVGAGTLKKKKIIKK